MNIVAIDPGTANTGVVYMSDRRIICCKTIHNDNGCKTDNKKLCARAESIAREIDEWITDKPHDMVVIEGFTYFSGQRQNAYTFQTPFLFGYLTGMLQATNRPFVVQTSNEVFSPRMRNSLCRGAVGKKDIDDMKRKAVMEYDGGTLCTNDHLRAAACHGIYYFRRINEKV